MQKLSIIFPVYNEEKTLLHVLNKVDKMPDNRKIDKVKRLFINL